MSVLLLLSLEVLRVEWGLANVCVRVYRRRTKRLNITGLEVRDRV